MPPKWRRPLTGQQRRPDQHQLLYLGGARSAAVQPPPPLPPRAPTPTRLAHVERKQEQKPEQVLESCSLPRPVLPLGASALS